uniref:cation-dependent mannose-6-phosphate receptor n=1 Tax=Pristiophorus japonicus TaxID=55135 RepID=UPI00398F64CF
RLRALSFKAKSSNTSNRESYTYIFRVCESAEIDPNIDPSAGLIQRDDTGNRLKVIGRINTTRVIGGSDWILLIYGDGDPYGTHCNQEKRKAMVMISCNPNVLGGGFTVVVEEREKVSDCFYLFKLDSSVACAAVTRSLSTGSILLIL